MNSLGPMCMGMAGSDRHDISIYEPVYIAKDTLEQTVRPYVGSCGALDDRTLKLMLKQPMPTFTVGTATLGGSHGHRRRRAAAHNRRMYAEEATGTARAAKHTMHNRRFVSDDFNPDVLEVVPSARQQSAEVLKVLFWRRPGEPLQPAQRTPSFSRILPGLTRGALAWAHRIR
jgi:hypothetical protein